VADPGPDSTDRSRPERGGQELRITPDGSEACLAAGSGERPGLGDERLPGPAVRPEGPVVRFAAFKVRKVRLKVSEKAYRDRFRIKGSFSLGEGSDGIDPLDEDVTVTFGGFSETIPAGSFVRFLEIITAGEGTAKGFRYQGNVGGVTRVKIRRNGRFRIRARGLRLGGLDRHAPIPFIFQIGNDLGQTEICFKRKSRFLKRGRGTGGNPDAR
jgi:hypothetical protein